MPLARPLAVALLALAGSARAEVTIKLATLAPTGSAWFAPPAVFSTQANTPWLDQANPGDARCDAATAKVVLDRILAEADRVMPHHSRVIMLVDGPLARVVRSRGFGDLDLADYRKSVGVNVDGVVFGAAYTDVHVRLPLLTALVAASLLAMVLSALNAALLDYRLPIAAVVIVFSSCTRLNGLAMKS